MVFASFLGWLAASGVLVVGAWRIVARRRAALAALDKRPTAQSKSALRQDLDYLTKQAAELRQLKEAAQASGSELDKYLEGLEWHQFVDDAARFIVAARKEGSKEFLKGAERIRDLLRSIGLTDAEFEQLLSDTAESQGTRNSQ